MTSSRNKAVLFVLLGVGVTLLYFGTLHDSIFPITLMPVTALDRVIPFSPIFVLPYLSFFLLIVAPLFAIHDREEILDTAFGFGLIVVVSALIFFFWPTSVAIIGRHPLNALLALDLQTNACPSLHASLALYSALCLQRHVRRAWARFGVWAWTVLVMASALLIKQHVAIDIAAGAALSLAVYKAVFHVPSKEAADSEPVLETLRIRDDFARQKSEEIIALTQHDARKRAQEFAVFLALVASGVSLTVWARSVSSTVLVVAGILMTAIALNAFPLLVHEGMHGMLLPNRQWNWIVSVLLGSTFLMSFSAYRVLHIRHHRYLGDPRDPDDYHNYSRSRVMVWFLHFVRLTVGPLLYLVLIPVLALRYGSKVRRKLICVEYPVLFVIYSIMLRAFPVHTLFLPWIVPLLLVGVFTAIRGFAQHGITDASDPYLASRTMLPNPAVAFFLLHENYHLEHHLFPEVPSYHLPGLHRLIWPAIPRAVSGHSYLAFLFAFLRATPQMDETPIGLLDKKNASSVHE